MPFNVLLLPLLGGYIFTTHWNRTRYATRRHSGERLIFHSALAGALFMAFGFLLTRLLLQLSPELGFAWRRLVPFPYSGTACAAFLAAVLAPWPLNRMRRFARKTEADRALEQSGDFLEMLLVRAVRRVKPVSVTLKSGKVYIGYVMGNLDPGFSRQYLSLLPLHSGFRSASDHRLTLVTSYSRVYKQIDQLHASSEPELDQYIRDFVIVLPVAEMQSVNIFDEEAFEMFNAPPDVAA